VKVKENLKPTLAVYNDRGKDQAGRRGFCNTAVCEGGGLDGSELGGPGGRKGKKGHRKTMGKESSWGNRQRARREHGGGSCNRAGSDLLTPRDYVFTYKSPCNPSPLHGRPCGNTWCFVGNESLSDSLYSWCFPQTYAPTGEGGVDVKGIQKVNYPSSQGDPKNGYRIYSKTNESSPTCPGGELE